MLCGFSVVVIYARQEKPYSIIIIHLCNIMCYAEVVENLLGLPYLHQFVVMVTSSVAGTF